MTKITGLQQQLLDEYYRCKRNLLIQKKRLSTLDIKGNLVQKKINGRFYFYLQWREGEKIKSKYIKKNDIDGVTHDLELRKRTEKNIKNLKMDMKLLEKALGKKLILEYAPNYTKWL